MGYSISDELERIDNNRQSAAQRFRNELQQKINKNQPRQQKYANNQQKRQQQHTDSRQNSHQKDNNSQKNRNKNFNNRQNWSKFKKEREETHNRKDRQQYSNYKRPINPAKTSYLMFLGELFRLLNPSVESLPLSQFPTLNARPRYPGLTILSHKIALPSFDRLLNGPISPNLPLIPDLSGLDDSVIKSIYRKVANTLHPDKSSDSVKLEILKLLNDERDKAYPKTQCQIEEPIGG